MKHFLLVIPEHRAEEVSNLKVGEEIEFIDKTETVTNKISKNQFETTDKEGNTTGYIVWIGEGL